MFSLQLPPVIPAITQISSRTSRLFVVNFCKELKLPIRTYELDFLGPNSEGTGIIAEDTNFCTLHSIIFALCIHHIRDFAHRFFKICICYFLSFRFSCCCHIGWRWHIGLAGWHTILLGEMVHWVPPLLLHSPHSPHSYLIFVTGTTCGACVIFFCPV